MMGCPNIRQHRWLGVYVAATVFTLSLWVDVARALVRIPLHRPIRRQRPLHPWRHHHHHHLYRTNVTSLQSHPLEMMQAGRQEGHADRVFTPPSHVALRNVDDAIYSATIALGSPPQNFTVLLDTGSTDAWVPSQRCETCGVTHRHFHGRRSASFTDLNTPFAGVYGSGSSNGNVVRDTLWVGDYAIPDFVFALITNETGDIPSFPTDGVLDLAFQGMSKVVDRRFPTLLDALVASSSAHSDEPLAPVFAFQLTTEADTTLSEFHFGGIDLTRVGAQPQVTYFPVLKLPGVESFRVVDVASDDENQDALSPLVDSPHPHHHDPDHCAPFCYAIVDSGTSLIYAPAHLYDAIIQQITRHQRHCDHETLQCRGTTRDAFPSLAFTFGVGDAKHQDPPVDNVFILGPERYVTCDDVTLPSVCTINILNHAEMGDGLFWWVLGDTFMQAFYTIFDVGQRRIGIACDATSDDCHITARAAP